MARYDLEDMLDDILAVMVSGLNTKIAAIEAEKIAKSKALTPTLAPIGATSYYRQSWSEKILNTNPAIFYGIEDVRTTDGGSVAAEVVKVFCEVVLCDNGMTNDAHSRIARYARALKELFQENYGSIATVGQIKIETVRPISFRLELDSSEEIKVGGVSLTVALA